MKGSTFCWENLLRVTRLLITFRAPCGLVAQLVEQCPFNSKTPILAIFSYGCLPLTSVAEPLISLVIIDVWTSSLVI
jgi:hypothetical protein